MPNITITALVKALPLIKSFYDHVQIFRKNSPEIDELIKRVQTLSTYVTILQENQSRLNADLIVFQDAIDHLETYINEGITLFQSFGEVTEFVLTESIKNEIQVIYARLGTYEQSLLAFCSIHQLQTNQSIMGYTEAQSHFLKNIQQALEQKKESVPRQSGYKVEGVADGGVTKELTIRIGGVRGLNVNIPQAALTEEHLKFLSGYQASLVPVIQMLMNFPQLQPGVDVTGVAKGGQSEKVEVRVGEREFLNLSVPDQPRDTLKEKVKDSKLPPPGEIPKGVPIMGVGPGGHADKVEMDFGLHIQLPDPPKPIPTLWNLTFSLEEKYFVRSKAYKKLTGAFPEFKERKTQEKAEQAVIVTLHGFGGVGKTHSAVFYTYHSTQAYSFVAWFSATSLEELNRDYKKFCEAFGIQLEKDATEEKIKDKVTGWLSTHPGWLLVYDNVFSYEKIMPYLPKTGGHILLTSRLSKEPPGIEIEVGVLEKNEAVELVKRRIYNNPEFKLTLSTEEALDELVGKKRLGYLALALAQASACIAQSKGRKTIESYLRRYKEYTDKELAERYLRSDEYPESIARTWLITMEEIQKQMPLALKVLQGCAYLASSAIPEKVVEELVRRLLQRKERIAEEEAKNIEELQLNLEEIKEQKNINRYDLIQQVHQLQKKSLEENADKCPDVTQDILICLTDYSMITSQLGDKTINIHTLVQQVIRSLKPELVDYSLILISIKDKSDIDKILQGNKGLHKNLIIFKQNEKFYINGLSPEWNPQLIENVSTEKLKQLEFTKNPRILLSHQIPQELKEEITLNKWHVGLTDQQILVQDVIKSLIFSYPTQGAEVYKRRQLWVAHFSAILDYYKAKKWPLTLYYAQAAEELGTIYVDDWLDGKRGKYYLKQTKAIYEKINTYFYPLGRALTTLGVAYGLLNQHRTKYNLLKRSLAIKKFYQETDKIECANTLIELGNACGKLGNRSKKLDLLEQAFIIEANYYKNSEDSRLISSRMNIANAYGDLGHYDEHRDRLNKILESFQEPYPFEMAVVLLNLGMVYGNLEERDKELYYLSNALTMYESRYGQNDPALITTLTCLSEAYTKLSDFQKARESLERILFIEERYFGPNDLQVGLTLDRLGTICGILGDGQKSYDCLKRALPILKTKSDLLPRIKVLSTQLMEIEKVIRVPDSKSSLKVRKIFDQERNDSDFHRRLLDFVELKSIKVKYNIIEGNLKNLLMQQTELGKLINDIQQFGYFGYSGNEEELNESAAEVYQIGQKFQIALSVLDELLVDIKSIKATVKSQDCSKICEKFIKNIQTSKNYVRSLLEMNQSISKHAMEIRLSYLLNSQMINFMRILHPPDSEGIVLSDDEDEKLPLDEKFYQSPSSSSSTVSFLSSERKVDVPSVLLETIEKVHYLIPKMNDKGINNKAYLLSLKAFIVNETDIAFKVKIASSMLNKAVRDQLSLERGWVKNLTLTQKEALAKIPSVVIEEGQSKQGSDGLLLTFFKSDFPVVNRILKDSKNTEAKAHNSSGSSNLSTFKLRQAQSVSNKTVTSCPTLLGR